MQENHNRFLDESERVTKEAMSRFILEIMPKSLEHIKNSLLFEMETDTTGRFANSGALTEVVAAPINIAHKPNLKVPKMGTFITVSKHEARYVEAEGKQKPQTKRKAADVVCAWRGAQEAR